MKIGGYDCLVSPLCVASELPEVDDSHLAFGEVSIGGTMMEIDLVGSLCIEWVSLWMCLGFVDQHK